MLKVIAGLGLMFVLVMFWLVSIILKKLNDFLDKVKNAKVIMKEVKDDSSSS